MKNTFCKEQRSKTGFLDGNLISRQYRLELMARFMEMKLVDPKLRQSEKAKELGMSSSTSQRYRHHKKMPSH